MRYKVKLDYKTDDLKVYYDDVEIHSVHEPDVGSICRIDELVRVANWCSFTPKRFILSAVMMD